MTETEFRNLLTEVLFFNDADGTEDVAAVSSFEENGLLTMNEGLVVRMADGSEFQLTVRKAR